MNIKTCVSPSGNFVFGIHNPCFHVENLREKDCIFSLGMFEDGSIRENHDNFPQGSVEEPHADLIFEVPNAFPFRGTTYIIKSAADRTARNPSAIDLPKPCAASLSDTLRKWLNADDLPADRLDKLFDMLPRPFRLALAADSTDSQELLRMAELCCKFVHDPVSGRPVGLRYRKDDQGRIRADIKDHILSEVLANNAFLPDDYKAVMVLKPGAQGSSEIVGECSDEKSHVFEYLRRNSYIPWGHYAANMAHDSIRYRVRDLSLRDMSGLRHLYYQRSYLRIAQELGISVSVNRRRLSDDELEELRKKICETLPTRKGTALQFDSTLWGWNFGFGYASGGYRLHGSHQQVHQQFALIPARVPTACQNDSQDMPTYSSGDLIHDFIREYREKTGKNFFDSYIRAIRSNSRMDGNKAGESRLTIYEDDEVILFVPKAQTSQWELQIMTLGTVGNILEADSRTRESLNRAMLFAVKILENMGARMITGIEYSKRFDSPDTDQRLMYCFLPKLPESPGAFTEAQLRWINGHYPEDFAAACRSRLSDIEVGRFCKSSC